MRAPLRLRYPVDACLRLEVATLAVGIRTKNWGWSTVKRSNFCGNSLQDHRLESAIARTLLFQRVLCMVSYSYSEFLRQFKPSSAFHARGCNSNNHVLLVLTTRARPYTSGREQVLLQNKPKKRQKTPESSARNSRFFAQIWQARSNILQL